MKTLDELVGKEVRVGLNKGGGYYFVQGFDGGFVRLAKISDAGDKLPPEWIPLRRVRSFTSLPWNNE